MGPPRKKAKKTSNQNLENDPSHVHVEELDPNRRPRSYCRALTQRDNNGKKTPMIFNDLGVAISKERAKWSSWVGKTARTRLNIAYNDWRKVPSAEKQRLWEECTV